MQIIDELEPSRRGPYGGGIGHVAFTGGMDMALALRTMVIPNPPSSPIGAGSDGNGGEPRAAWTVHLQVTSPSGFNPMKGLVSIEHIAGGLGLCREAPGTLNTPGGSCDT